MYMYIFRSTTALVIVVFTSNSTLRCHTTMLSLNMCIESRIWKITKLTTSTSILSALFIIPSLSSFFLFILIQCLRILRVIFNIKIMYHVHSLHCTMIYHFSFPFIILLSDWKKLCIILLLSDVWLLFSSWKYWRTIITYWRHLFLFINNDWCFCFLYFWKIYISKRGLVYY